MKENIMEELQEDFQKQKKEMEYSIQEYETCKNPDSLILAGQCWGQMCGIARAANAFGYPDLWEEIKGKTPKLYPMEYEERA